MVMSPAIFRAILPVVFLPAGKSASIGAIAKAHRLVVTTITRRSGNSLPNIVRIGDGVSGSESFPKCSRMMWKALSLAGEEE